MYGKRLGRNNYTHQRGFIGIEITNNTAEKQNLKFLGLRHRHYQKQGVVLKNILNDTIFDNSDITMLSDWIMSVGLLRINSIILHSSLMYGAFDGKAFSLTNTYATGRQENTRLLWNSYLNPYRHDNQQVKIINQFSLDWTTELMQTEIHAGEIVTIIFDLGRNHSEKEMDELYSKVNSQFSKSKRRKLLLIL